MKRLMLSLLVLSLLIGMAVPLYAEEVGITLESLAAKLESLTQQMESWTQKIERLTQQLESVESRLATLEATPTPPVHTPVPTPDASRIIEPGMHLVGIDIQPGLYVGDAGNVSVYDGCKWERLSSLLGESGSTLGRGLQSGQYYVEVAETDEAFKTTCELLPIELVPPRTEFLTRLPAGMYLIGRDIGPGIYRGQASNDDSCAWMRLADAKFPTRGDRWLGYGNEETLFLIKVLPTDFALLVRCPVELVEQ